MAKVWEPTETLRPDTGKAMGVPAYCKGSLVSYFYVAEHCWQILGFPHKVMYVCFGSILIEARQVMVFSSRERTENPSWDMALDHFFANLTFRWSNMVGRKIDHKWTFQLNNHRTKWTMFCGFAVLPRCHEAGSNYFPPAAARRGATMCGSQWTYHDPNNEVDLLVNHPQYFQEWVVYRPSPEGMFDYRVTTVCKTCWKYRFDISYE